MPTIIGLDGCSAGWVSASKNLKKNAVFFDDTNQTISDVSTIQEILNQIKNA